MLLSRVNVKNYRSLLDIEVSCSHLSAFVGANGMGKSNIIRSVELFYSTNPQLAAEDWFNKNTDPEIAITLTFNKLGDEAKKRFAAYLQGEDLSVTRKFVMAQTGKVTDTYHGATRQNPAFKDLWAASAAQLKVEYNKLREQEPYKTDLPSYTNQDAAKAALRTWEGNHPDTCILASDDGQFFGFKQVGQGYLGDFTRLVFVPAVRDLSDDAAESRGSAVTALVDIVARNILAAQKDFRDLEAEMQEKYGKLLVPSQDKELDALAAELSGTLQTIAPDAGVHLKWLPPPPVQFPMPKVDVQLSEDGQPFSIAGTGHGLQRAFIVTLLQHLAVAQRKRAEAEAASPGDSPISIPNIILAIEEPELYQHPTRQRHLARLLLSLSQGKSRGLADTTQVMYATHCPLFVGIDRFDEVRIVTKSAPDGGKPRFSEVAFKTLDDVARIQEGIERAATGSFTAASVQARLATIMTPWLSEGFFADVLLLVEGPSDRAAILGVAEKLGYDFDQLGIAVLPCDSKSKLLTAATIFRAFDLPTFCVWDGDAHLGPTQGRCVTCNKPLDKKPAPIENQRIMRLLGKADDEWPSFIDDDGACFPHCLEQTLEQELGDGRYPRLMRDVADEFGYTKLEYAKKNPSVVAEVMRRAASEGASSPSLELIVQNAYKMRRPTISMEVAIGSSDTTGTQTVPAAHALL